MSWPPQNGGAKPKSGGGKEIFPALRADSYRSPPLQKTCRSPWTQRETRKAFLMRYAMDYDIMYICKKKKVQHTLKKVAGAAVALLYQHTIYNKRRIFYMLYTSMQLQIYGGHIGVSLPPEPQCVYINIA